jgi:hypothetical protein
VAEGEKVPAGEKPSVGTLAEPRIACPKCGAHLLVVAWTGDEASMLCPVCQFRGRSVDGATVEPTD